MEKKEERIRAIALSYYSRKDILNYLFKFSQNREVSPRYFEGFGKRPDSFQYPSDILSLVKKGATSFHCSEEHWEDPLRLSTDLNQEQLNKLRIGWDLIVDIDCKWLDYSKKAAEAVVIALANKGVKNIGVKYSGSKGFHIIIPYSSFPENIDGINTKNMFPEWPKIIIEYLKEISRPVLENLIKDMLSDFSNVKGFTGVKCEKCNNLADENYQITTRCGKCYPPYIETFKSSSQEYKDKKCPHCKSVLQEQNKKKFYVCSRCNINSFASPESFNEGITATDIFKILGLDLQLVSSRHLFRMPYSLHEKTALASIVLDKDKIKEFNIKDADPLNINIKEFIPEAKKDEAKNLLIHAIDWYKSERAEDKKIDYNSINNLLDKKEFKKIELNKNQIVEDNFPPVINKILKGMEDGKKRALFILLNFYRSLGLQMEEVEKKINEWNTRNKPPLKEGYIKAQLIWHAKQKLVLPPNFDNNLYKDLGVFEMDSLSEKTKNPVNYVIRKSGAWRENSKEKTYSKTKRKKSGRKED